MKKFQQRAYKRRWAATTRHLKKQCRQSTLELESDDSEQENDTTIFTTPETVTTLQYMDAAETAYCTAAGADNATYSGPDSDEPDENDADWRLIDHHVTLSSDSENESDSDCFEDILRSGLFYLQNSFCYWPKPNPTHSRIRRAEIPDKEVWDRLPIRVFRKTLTEDFDKALQYEKQAEMFSSPEEEEMSTKWSHITPERYRNDEEDVFDADGEEEIRPKKKCRKEKLQILIQAPPLPVLPPLNFPNSSEYQTTSASTSQYYTTPRHPGRLHSPARSSTYRLSPDKESCIQLKPVPNHSSQYESVPDHSKKQQECP
nr:uncharacterized protein LOC133612342 [Nerophis lumbriciformis]